MIELFTRPKIKPALQLCRANSLLENNYFSRSFFFMSEQKTWIYFSNSNPIVKWKPAGGRLARMVIS